MQITSNWALPNEGIRFLVPQFLQNWLQLSPLTQDLYPIALGYYPVALNQVMNRSNHDNHLVMYCTHGKGWVTAGEQSFQVTAGDVFCLPQGVAHSYGADSSDPWTIYWVHYGGALSSDYNQFFAADNTVVQVGIQPRLRADFEALFSLRKAGYSSVEFVHGACQLKQMLSYIAVLAKRSLSRQGRFNLDDIEELMTMHIESSLDLESLAAQAQLSKYHFSRKFKQLTGHSPIQHFLHLKIQHACLLLDTSENSIKQIADEVGYGDAYYFSRLFKQVMGVSPSGYRSKLKV
jgi:AraC-like DNA-binding protein